MVGHSAGEQDYTAGFYNTLSAAGPLQVTEERKVYLKDKPACRQPGDKGQTTKDESLDQGALNPLPLALC